MAHPEVYVVGDWDADGVVSAAEILYAQRNLGLYPLRRRCSVVTKPAGPRSVEGIVGEVLGSGAEALVVLDIPYGSRVAELLRRARAKGMYVVYVDHHLSTIFRSGEVEKQVNELIVGRVPTALLVYHLLKTLGARLTPRLEMFVKATSVVERSKRPSPQLERMVRLVVDVSKALTHLRDEELWRRVVEWLASPLALASMPFAQGVVDAIRRAGEPGDRALHELAIELAPTARRIFNLRLVDARRRLRSRGASALASMLYRTFRSPVAVVAEARDGSPLLIIRGRGTLPYRVAQVLVKQGVVEDVGGHQSLALLKLRRGLEIGEIEALLRRAVLEASRER